MSTTPQTIDIIHTIVLPVLTGVSSYAAGTSLDVSVSIVNKTASDNYATRVFYSFYFGYMENGYFVLVETGDEYEAVQDPATGADLQLNPGILFNFTFSHTLPADTTPGTNYCYKIIVVPDKAIIDPMVLRPCVAYTDIFSVALLSSDCALLKLVLDTPTPVTCLINHGNATISATVPYGTSIVALTPTFIISAGATAYIGAVLQTSGVTTNDYTGPVVYKILAEDRVMNREYTLTVTIAGKIFGDRAVLGLYTPNGAYPDVLKIGQTARLSCSVANTSSTVDYAGTEGAVIYIYYQNPVTLIWVMLPEATIPINKLIPHRVTIKGSLKTYYETCVGSWKVRDNIPYGQYGTLTMQMKLSGGSMSTLPFTITLIKEQPLIDTLAYSEKLNLFQGDRTYKSYHFFRLDNTLYSARELDGDTGDTGKSILKFYKQDVTNELFLYSHIKNDVVKWDLIFYVNNPVAQVIFQSIVLECGEYSGERLGIDSIEYNTSKYHVHQDPFFDDAIYEAAGKLKGISYQWENPWQPVWKNDKWYLSIKNATDDTKLITKQKLKGMWIKITLNGTGGDMMFIRSVVTKIAHQFN